MQFIVIGRDGDDENAPSRRMAVRSQHIDYARAAHEAGVLLYACGLKDGGVLVGSVMIFEFPDKPALEAHLAKEPYITGDVWLDIEIKEAGVPDFLLAV